MTEADRKQLRVNRVNLVKNMILGEEFFSVMREDKVFTADLQEEVMVNFVLLFFLINCLNFWCLTSFLFLCQDMFPLMKLLSL